MKKLISKYQFGGGLSPEEQRYLQWRRMTPQQKRDRNATIAQNFLSKGPSISNYWNAAKAYFGGFNPDNPKLSTGEPGMLPGRMNNVLLMEKEAPTMFKMVAENANDMKQLTWSRLADSRTSVIDGLKKFFSTGDKNLLKLLEQWAIKNKHLFIRLKSDPAIVTPKGYLNNSSLDKAVDYTQRGLTKPKPMSDQQWGDSDFEDFGGYIDRVTSIYRKGGRLFGINSIGL